LDEKTQFVIWQCDFCAPRGRAITVFASKSETRVPADVVVQRTAKYAKYAKYAKWHKNLWIEYKRTRHQDAINDRFRDLGKILVPRRGNLMPYIIIQ